MKKKRGAKDKVEGSKRGKRQRTKESQQTRGAGKADKGENTSQGQGNLKHTKSGEGQQNAIFTVKRNMYCTRAKRSGRGA